MSALSAEERTWSFYKMGSKFNFIAAYCLARNYFTEIDCPNQIKNVT